MSVTSIVCCSVTPAMAHTVARTVAHTVTHTVTATVARAVTPDGDWNGTRRRCRNASSSDAQALGREWAGGGRSPYIRGLGGDGWFGSHFWRNYV